MSETEKPWYENNDNIVALARWMEARSNPSHANHTVVAMLRDPEDFTDIWRDYQASLQPEPEEPTLSEEVERLSQWVNTTPNSFETCYAIDQSIINLLKQMAQRLEGLEAKERDREVGGN